MQIILTHEQADFDAVASLLGAALVDVNALAVLPNRINRNVRAFLNLYSTEFPFIKQDDLPGTGIDVITLVDTQALITLKGVAKNTKVKIIDHHQKKNNLPDNWSCVIEYVGATTTLLVETLRDCSFVLNMVQATLLLLGIYEDTGSLTYTNTTARDAAAAAFLIDQGASLRILNDFLNPPLSGPQNALLDALQKSAISMTINGAQIVIMTAAAYDMDDEISSIAHKLRDRLDPDALFLLIALQDGIHLVCRSTSDQVNVAQVAENFGGGGHERAAGALISFPKNVAKETSLDLQDYVKKLIEILNDVIKPAITVGEIMSGKPVQIEPETSAKEASILMQKYGYEGYPVVESGKLAGLLTRRAVDRALAHRLDLSAANLMEAGNVSVFPFDSLETLQNRMAESGWGQVPVMDPVTSKIIGIVTRTDLLKAMAKSEKFSQSQINLSEKMERYLPPAQFKLLKQIADQANEDHLAIYMVGGPVRDLLLERSSPDLDLVVEGDAIQFAKKIASRFGGLVTAHNKFGTAKWNFSELQDAVSKSTGLSVDEEKHFLLSSIDFITARTEFYDFPTALPTIEHANIKLDLHRRDFTINTMAIRLDGNHFGELFDFYGGMSDLKKGLIRVLHSLSFVDDPTRLLRAIRFEKRFGFTIEERTLELMQGGADLLREVSGDRLRHEFNLILDESAAAQMNSRAHELGLLEIIHPAMKWGAEENQMFDLLHQPGSPDEWKLPKRYAGLPLATAMLYLGWFSPLNLQQIQSLAQRLRFPQSLLSAMRANCSLNEMLDGFRGKSPSQITSILDQFPAIVIALHAYLEKNDSLRTMLINYLSQWRNIHAHASGYDLQKMGLTPGPRYHQILDRLRAAWLDGKVTNIEEENILLKDLLKENLT